MMDNLIPKPSQTHSFPINTQAKFISFLLKNAMPKTKNAHKKTH